MCVVCSLLCAGVGCVLFAVRRALRVVCCVVIVVCCLLFAV